jgi:uncharacterized protein YqhQ
MSEIHLGGMALRDGVLLQSERFWSASVRTPDGGIVTASGRKPQVPGRGLMLQMPVVRGLVRLGESLAVLPAVRRGTGGPVLPQEEPRMLAATAVSAVAGVALRRAPWAPPVVREAAVAGVSLVPVLLALRDSRLARYHGAEHKSVAAFESGAAPDEAEKEHVRCGTNLIVPLLLTNIATSLLLHGARRANRPLASFVAGLVSIGTAMELFTWMARHGEHPLAQALQRPGLELQRLVTTSEPSGEQLDVAQAALRELLRLEDDAAAAAGLTASGSEAAPATPVA